MVAALQEAEEILEDLRDFKPSRVHISHEILNGINSILSLIEKSDREKIINLFYEGINSVRSKDGARLERIKKVSSKFLGYYNENYQAIFHNFYKAQKDIFQNHDYLTQFNFNSESVNDEKFISNSDKHLLDMIQELLFDGRLKSKYVKNNIEKIKNAVISKGKAIFINDKINDLLVTNDDTSDIDFEKLKEILNSIKSKNQKVIQESDNILGKISEEEIQKEYSDLLQERAQKSRDKEFLESYKKLMYEYMIAEKHGNTEKLETLKAKLSELELVISPEEKMITNLRIEEKISQEENDRMQRAENREKELSKNLKENKKFKEMRKKAESNLMRSGKLDETENTVAKEDGEFETIVDKEAREQQVFDEIKRIEEEQNTQGGLKI